MRSNFESPAGTSRIQPVLSPVADVLKNLTINMSYLVDANKFVEILVHFFHKIEYF